MSRTELSWAAGFFDGEGCITCRKRQIPKRLKEWKVYLKNRAHSWDYVKGWR